MGKVQLVQQTNPAAVASTTVLSANSVSGKLTQVLPAGTADTIGGMRAASTAQQTGFATDTQVAGSRILIPAGLLRVGSIYRCKFDMTKTAAGTATPIVTVRLGTAGTIADTARLTFTFGAGTAAVDEGEFQIEVIVRVAGASCVIAGKCTLKHHLAVTGLTSTTGVSGFSQFKAASSAFDATVAATYISIGFNGGTSFAGTNEVVFSELLDC